MHLTNKVRLKNGIRFLFCVIDIDSKYDCVIPLKDKNRITITNGFQKILDKSNRKPKNMGR